MKTCRRVSGLLAAAVLGLAAANARAVEPFSIGGHALGLPYDSVLNDPAYDCESLAGCFLYSACAYKATGTVAFMGAPIEGVTLYFTGERLSGISAGFRMNQFDEVADALSRQYGPGTTERRRDEAATTSAGAILIWRQGSKVLRLERTGNAGLSSVIVAERNFISELIERP